jgi:hypothetical protein
VPAGVEQRARRLERARDDVGQIGRRELQLQLAPLLLHAGARLFDGLEAANPGFALRGPVTATTVAHLTYDVRRT